MTRHEVLSVIREHGIVPAVRVPTEEDALFAAQAVYNAGIPIVEITMTTPGALEVISRLRRVAGDMCIGAGTVLDDETAECCLRAGACFVTSTGFDEELMALARKEDFTYIPGGLTPTEIINAWKAGADFVKVFPCAAVGGETYIRALKAPLPQVSLIASGGVTQITARGFIRAGAAAIGVGRELVPEEAVAARKQDQVRELARRFRKIVHEARMGM